jgi:hypothetical protein
MKFLIFFEFFLQNIFFPFLTYMFPLFMHTFVEWSILPMSAPLRTWRSNLGSESVKTWFCILATSYCDINIYCVLPLLSNAFDQTVSRVFLEQWLISSFSDLKRLNVYVIINLLSNRAICFESSHQNKTLDVLSCLHKHVLNSMRKSFFSFWQSCILCFNVN